MTRRRDARIISARAAVSLHQHEHPDPRTLTRPTSSCARVGSAHRRILSTGARWHVTLRARHDLRSDVAIVRCRLGLLRRAGHAATFWPGRAVACTPLAGKRQREGEGPWVSAASSGESQPARCFKRLGSDRRSGGARERIEAGI
jgi:hypothetical protein